MVTGAVGVVAGRSAGHTEAVEKNQKSEINHNMREEITLKCTTSAMEVKHFYH